MKYQRRLKVISKINTPQVNLFEGGGGLPSEKDAGLVNTSNISLPEVRMDVQPNYSSSSGTLDTKNLQSQINASIAKLNTKNGSENASSNQGLAAGLMSAAGSLNSLIGNAISQASINDPEEMKNNYRNQLGGLDTSSFDALNASKKANIANVTASDFHNMTKGSGVLNGISAGDVGATAGNAIVPGWGALVGGVLGTGSSIVGTIIGRKRARNAVEPMNDFIREINKLNNQNFVNQNNNLLANQVSSLEANYAAKGGFLNMDNNIYESSGDMRYYAPSANYQGLLEYPNFEGPASYSYGGQLGNHPNDFSNGLLQINNGGSHEMNPYQGVQMGVDPQGTPNLVEEGETVFGDFVFSNRITVPKDVLASFGIKSKKKMTYADVSKYLAKESEERPNDNISQKGLERNLGLLSDAQEKQKLQEDAEKRLAQAMNAVNPNMPADPMMAMQGEEQMQEDQMAQDQMAQEQAMQEQVAQEQMAQQGGQPMMMAEGGNLNIKTVDNLPTDGKIVEKPEAPYLYPNYGYTEPQKLEALNPYIQDLDYAKTLAGNIPIAGSVIAATDLYQDPSWQNLGSLGLNLLSDYANLMGGIPVGAALRNANRAWRAANRLVGRRLPLSIKTKYNQRLPFKYFEPEFTEHPTLDMKITPSDAMPRDATRVFTYTPSTSANIYARGSKINKVDSAPINVMDFEDLLYEYTKELGYIPDYEDVFKALYGSSDKGSDTIDIPNITQENENQLKESYNIIKRQLTEDPSFRHRMDSGYKPDEIKLPPIPPSNNLEDTSEYKFGEKIKQIKNNEDWVSEDLAKMRDKYAKPGWISPEYNLDHHMIEYYNKPKNQTEYYITPYPESYKDNPNDYFNDPQQVIIDPVNGIVSNFGYGKKLMDDYQGSMEAGNTEYHYKEDESLLQDPNFIEALRIAGMDANSIEELEKDPTYKHLTDVIRANPDKWAPFLWSIKNHSKATNVSLDFFNDDGSINYGKFERNFNNQFPRVRFDGIGGIAHWVAGLLNPSMVKKGNHVGETLQPVAENKAEDKTEGSKLPEKRGEFLRYAGVLGDAFAGVMTALSKPNYDNVNDYFKSVKGMYSPVEYNPIGGYLPYKPVDVNKMINDQNANTAATRRALMDAHAGNRGSMSGALTMLNNGHLRTIGDNYIAATEANWKMLQDKEKFNRETESANSEGFLKAAMANQSALAAMRDSFYNAYKWKDDIYQKNKIAKVQAYNNLFSDLSEIGKDVMNYNDNVRITNAGGYGNGAQQMLAGHRDYKKDQNADGTWADNTYMNTNQQLKKKNKKK